jgi:hypothetical protein
LNVPKPSIETLWPEEREEVMVSRIADRAAAESALDRPLLDDTMDMKSTFFTLEGESLEEEEEEAAAEEEEEEEDGEVEDGTELPLLASAVVVCAVPP